MDRLIPLLLLLGAMLSACAPTLPRNQAFSNQWASQAEHERKSAPLESGEILLTGKGGKGPVTAIRRDEKGRPKVQLGRDTGFQADVDVDSDETEVELRYKLKW